MDDRTRQSEASDRWRVTAAAWVTRVSLAVAVLGLLLLARTLPAADAIQTLVTRVERWGVLGPFAFIGLYTFVTVLMAPAWPFSVAAGAVFGLLTGFASVFVGAVLGMAAAFLISRYAARPLVERRIRRHPRFSAIDRAVAREGWKIVVLLRLSPAVPFNLQNYLYGLTAIRFRPCMIASAMAIVPGTFMYVYLGHAGRAGINAAGAHASQRGAGQWTILFIGLAATVVATIYITRLASRAIREQTLAEGWPDATEGGDTARGNNPWIGAIASSIAAVLVLLAVGFVRFSPNLVLYAFGPPSVSMNEAYAANEEGPTFDHSAYDALLKRFVDDRGGVDYAGLRGESVALEAYTASLADAPFSAMTRDDRLALLLNAYNAFTLQLIVEWLDQDIRSIRDIPSDKRWEDTRWNLGGDILSLDQIEHERIRPNFREPDVHWALVCAAVGCPPLRPEAYAADRIEEQLEEQARIVHADPSRWFRFDPEAGIVRLTPLYKWYAGDFEQVSGSVLEHAARYSPSLAKRLEAGGRPRMEWLDYDWRLNSRENLK